MTELSDLLTPDTVVSGLVTANKKNLLQQLGALAERHWGIGGKAVAERLAEREKLGSTGFGGGIALPHGRIDSIQRVTGLFVRLARPVDFNAIDDLPVDLVFLLMSPPDAGADHLKALASVSRRLRDRGFADKLRGAGSPDALYVLLTGIEARDAA